jgi:S1-C subfamily serine protease
MPDHDKLTIAALRAQLPREIHDHPAIAPLLDQFLFNDDQARARALNQIDPMQVLRSSSGGNKPLKMPWDFQPNNSTSENEVLGFELMDLIRASCVCINSKNGSFAGSGVVVKSKRLDSSWPDLVLLTSNHVVATSNGGFQNALAREDAACTVTTRKGSQITFTLDDQLWSDPRDDPRTAIGIGVFKIALESIVIQAAQDDNNPKLKGADFAKVKLGDEIFPTGFIRTGGSVSPVISIDKPAFRKVGLRVDDRFGYRAWTDNGMSGGPVINRRGKVVGIHHGQWSDQSEETPSVIALVSNAADAVSSIASNPN